MKKIFILIAAIVFVGNLAFAQKNKKDKDVVVEKKDEDRFRWEGYKLVPKMKALAITQLTVNYKLTTTAKTIAQAKNTRDIAGARVSAYLETTDGDLTQDDVQEITDYFYHYFQKKLKEGGVDTIGWNTITATDFYQKIGEDEEKESSKTEKGGNEWLTATANKGKIVHSGMAGFAFGKGKRSVTFADDLNAYGVAFKLNLDFADVMVNLDIKGQAAQDLGNGWYRPHTTSKTYTWAVNPMMQIGDQPTTLSLLWNGKGGAEYLWLWSDIPVNAPYADTMTEDVSKARSGIAKQFAFRKELTPVLIETTRDKYKAAAKIACEKYAEAFVARVVKMRKVEK